MSLKQFSQEQIAEMSLIELAYELLVERNEPIFFNDLVEEIAGIKGASKSEIASKIAQFYTDLNIDGRFTSLGENRWGLKTWYPVDQVEEEVVHTVKAKKKKKAKKAAVVDDLELDDDIEDLEDEDLDEDLLDEDDDLLDDDLEELDEDLDEDDDDLLDEDDDLEVLDEDLDEDLIDEEEELELDEEELDEEKDKDK